MSRPDSVYSGTVPLLPDVTRRQILDLSEAHFNPHADPQLSLDLVPDQWESPCDWDVDGFSISFHQGGFDYYYYGYDDEAVPAFLNELTKYASAGWMGRAGYDDDNDDECMEPYGFTERMRVQAQYDDAVQACTYAEQHRLSIQQQLEGLES